MSRPRHLGEGGGVPPDSLKGGGLKKKRLKRGGVKSCQQEQNSATRCSGKTSAKAEIVLNTHFFRLRRAIIITPTTGYVMNPHARVYHSIKANIRR